jgi:hypothetical protein
MNFGITLSNRGIPVGLCSARDLLALADAVEACPAMDSVWSATHCSSIAASMH